MNELLDKVIIRLVFTIFICLILFVYRYAHAFLYPSARSQFLKKITPNKNSADSVHMFARILGMALIMSEFYFYLSDGILIALLDFSIMSTASFITFIASIYIAESIVLYNFEYSDEILKRKNMAYAIISFSMVIGLAYIIKTAAAVSKDSPIVFLFIWLFAIVLFGFATKSYTFFSKLPFGRLIIQKNVAIGLSYSGFIWGWSLIIASAINHPMINIKWYLSHSMIKILLSIIILPLFQRGLVKIFKIAVTKNDDQSVDGPEVGDGIYEGIAFLSACLLTSVITGNIHFGTFYPIF
ncbi:MAG: hypothetical protein KAG61_03735 [Bacteriovoracaceae bacterium]|nr:hypothetical protein [Bacteriovoracaceae bacterium]